MLYLIKFWKKNLEEIVKEALRRSKKESQDEFLKNGEDVLKECMKKFMLELLEEFPEKYLKEHSSSLHRKTT